MSYLKFNYVGDTKSKKTKIWSVISNPNGHVIGKVFWYSPWRKYVFKSYYDSIILDDLCLNVLRNFLAEETDKHKIK